MNDLIPIDYNHIPSHVDEISISKFLSSDNKAIFLLPVLFLLFYKNNKTSHGNHRNPRGSMINPRTLDKASFLLSSLKKANNLNDMRRSTTHARTKVDGRNVDFFKELLTLFNDPENRNKHIHNISKALSTFEKIHGIKKNLDIKKIQSIMKENKGDMISLISNLSEVVLPALPPEHAKSVENITKMTQMAQLMSILNSDDEEEDAKDGDDGANSKE